MSRLRIDSREGRMRSVNGCTAVEDREMERWLDAAAARMRAVPLPFRTLTPAQFAALDAFDGPEALGTLPRR